MKILKFGGSSVRTPENIRNVQDILVESLSKGKIAVVVSAFGGVTDQLIKMANTASCGNSDYLDNLDEFRTRHLDSVKALVNPQDQERVCSTINNLIRELSDLLQGMSLVRNLAPITLDHILSFGERLSAYIISESLKSDKMDAEYLDASKIIVTDSTFGAARVDFDVTNARIKSYFETHNAVQVITGFIASDSGGEITTMGRSGSDYTASIFGAALDVGEIEIWTDVDGVMTADPRKVPGALAIRYMTYEEAMEMSHFGAKVIFPPTLQPAMKKSIPIRIKNTFHPKFEGTVIGRKSGKRESLITGFSSIENIALIRVQGSGMIGVTGITGRIFQAIARKEINVFLISLASSEHSICFAVDPSDAENAKNVIEEEFALEIQVGMIDKVRIERNLSILAVVGEKMRHTPGISGWVFSALGNHKINVVAIAQGSSERNISIVLEQEDEAKAIRVLHENFFSPKKKIIDLFLVGTGAVGGELLRLIEKSQLKDVSIRIIGIANSRKMVFNTAGIALDLWEDKLAKSEEELDMDAFVNQMIDQKCTNAVFVDCTADKSVARRYADILYHSISVVTPNKIANTLEWKQYLALRNASVSNGSKFLYSTNVGAGLPVIDTLKGLIKGGDTVLKIEAVLSGTLSFIFNSLSEEKTFSKMAAAAKKMGYAEPDIRDDLNGVDVARKLLILAREMDYSLELKDISIESLLPKNSDDTESIDLFLNLLPQFDGEFEKKRLDAERQGKVLRYIASFENGKAEVSLKQVGQKHPFYSLSGNENIIAFTTKRYSSVPLIIRGTGSGVKETAAGVLVDIINCI